MDVVCRGDSTGLDAFGGTKGPCIDAGKLPPTMQGPFVLTSEDVLWITCGVFSDALASPVSAASSRGHA